MAVDLLPQILPHVKAHIYPSSIPLSDWKMREGELKNAFLQKLPDFSWKAITLPSHWAGYDKTVWFRRLVAVPPEFAGKTVALLIDVQEGLVYVNGTPRQGVDINHPEVILTDRARKNQPFFVAIEASSGRKKELSTFAKAMLAVVNPTARSLYYGLNALHELEKALGPSASETKDIKEIIRQTLIFLKYFKPEGEEYPNAIGRALNFLTRTLDEQYKTDIAGLVHLVGHSHIDVVWLWRIRETKKKCGRTFSTALRLIDEYPEFTFTQSQALLYEFAKERYPDIYQEIKQRVSEGRWFPVGSTWVEPDCNLPNGESLVRQILYGKRFFQQEFGIDSNILWLPDTFGYSWALPQMMKKSGIKYFATTKLTWNDTTKFPHNSFWWRGLDGTKILTHLTPVGLEGLVTPKDIKKSWEAYQEKEKSENVLQTFGFGDGGGGPTREHVESARFLKTITGLPSSRLSTLQEFFTQLALEGKHLPIWEDEIYLEKHRGTYTTHGWVKRENRNAERLLYTTELFSVLGMLVGKKPTARRYPAFELERAWKLLLLNQFHDILPGTFIAAAYEDIQKDFKELRTACNRLQKQYLESVMSKPKKKEKDFHFTIFNTLPWGRSAYVTLEVKSKEPGFLVLDQSGRQLETQILERRSGRTRLLCYVDQIPPLSLRQLMVVPTKKKGEHPHSWKVTPKLVETSLFKVHFDAKGQFSSVYDKTLRRELLAPKSRGNQFQTFKDQPKQWDAWDIDPEYSQKSVDTLKFRSIKVIEEGPLRAVLRVQHQSDKGSKVTQDITFYHTLQRIDFQTHAVWKERQILWKVAFPLNVKGNQATYEIQFGSVQRPTKSSDPHQKAKYEVPAQQWADMSEAKFGVSLLNDCKYGHDAKENVLRLTLLRSPYYPHPVEPWRFNDDVLTDQGEHEFSYALLPHAGNWRDGITVRAAREFNHPVLVLSGHYQPPPSLIVTEDKNILIESIKKAEESDEVVVRAYEAHGQTTRATFEVGWRVDQLVECDLLEENPTPLKVAHSTFSVKFSPFEIKTFKLKIRPKQ
jgi:alpha-mannosidase